jgi:hypothetical protein
MNIRTNVKESEKTLDWIEKQVMIIRDGLLTNDDPMSKDVECWKMYHNTFEDHKYDYLRKYGDYVLPSSVRRIPLQKHFIKLLVSQEARRNAFFSIVAIDEDAQEERFQKRANEYVQKFMFRIKKAAQQRSRNLQEMESGLNDMKQKIQSFQPQTEDDMMKLQEAIRVLSQFEVEVMDAREFIKIQDLFDERDLQDMEKYNLYTEQDWNEERVQKLYANLVEKLRIRSKRITAFERRCVIGRSAYYVDCVPGLKDPVFEVLNPMMVYYPQIDDVKFIQDGPWVAIKDVLSFDQISTMYGHKIEKKYGKDELNNLENNPVYESTAVFLATKEGALLAPESTYKGSTQTDQKYERVRVWFKSQRKVAIKISKNEEGQVFKHDLDPFRETIDKSEYSFKNGFYVNKKDKKISYRKDQVNVFDSKRGDDIEYRYTNDVYEAVVICGKYVIDARKKQHVVRDPFRHSSVKLPVFGKSYSGADETPSSIVWDTKDLAELYRIVWYHIELQMALAGTKTMLIDRSQKPTSMTEEEWEYHMKQGRLYIQTTDNNGRQINGSFNQWQTFDNSISASIAYYQPVLEMIYQVMGTIIGIPRPRLGQVVGSDQVGTFEMSLQQSSLITEILYEEHDEDLKYALEQLVNIAVKYNYKSGCTFEIKNPKLNAREQVVIPPEEFAKHYYSAVMDNTSKDERNLRDLKELAMAQWQKAMIPLEQIVKMYNVDSVKELEKTIEYFNGKAIEMQQLNQQNNIEAQQQVEQMRIELQAKYDMELEKMKQQVEMMKLKLEESRTMLENGIATKGLELEEKKIGVDANLRMMEMQYEDKTESGLLQENKDARITGNRIDLLKLQMDSLLGHKKIETTKVQKQKVEHLNDN